MTVSADPRITAPFAVAAAPLHVEEPIVWKPCPTCWSQGREFVQDDDGQWWQRMCCECLGFREVMA